MDNIHQFGLYRNKYLTDYSPSYGEKNYFKFYSNRITGWRVSQEDRLVCLPNFHKDDSFFAVYDGHGGELVVEYLNQNLHQHILQALKENDDVEKSLQLGFISCDNYLRNITEEELSPVKNAIIKEYDITEVTSGTLNDPARASSSSAETSNNLSGINKMDFQAVIANEVRNHILENPTLLKNMADSFKEIANLDITSTLSDEKDDDDDGSGESESDNDAFFIEEADEKSKGASNEKGDDDDDDRENDENENEKRAWKKSMGDSASSSSNEKKADEYGSIPVQVPEKDVENGQNNVRLDNSVNNSNENLLDEKKCDDAPLVGLSCGSTATVVIINEKKVYVANVGDSRCVASVNGLAVDLTVDHKPTDREELMRINRAGCQVSEDGRIDGGLNVSRAFGDYGLKMKYVEDQCQPVICSPHVSCLDISKQMEFIVIASDGIWNSLGSKEVINFIQENRTANLEDICKKLFEEILTDEITEDGDSCDNMSIIIIDFQNIPKIGHNENAYKYSYPSKEAVDNEECKEVSEDIEILESEKNQKTVTSKNKIFCSSSLNPTNQEKTSVPQESSRNVIDNEYINSLQSLPQQENDYISSNLKLLIMESIDYIAEMKASISRIKLFLDNFDNLLNRIDPNLFRYYSNVCSDAVPIASTLMQRPYDHNMTSFQSYDPVPSTSTQRVPLPQDNHVPFPVSKEARRKFMREKYSKSDHFEVVDLVDDDEGDSSQVSAEINKNDCDNLEMEIMDSDSSRAKRSADDLYLDNKKLKKYEEISSPSDAENDTGEFKDVCDDNEKKY